MSKKFWQSFGASLLCDAGILTPSPGKGKQHFQLPPEHVLLLSWGTGTQEQDTSCQEPGCAIHVTTSAGQDQLVPQKPPA